MIKTASRFTDTSSFVNQSPDEAWLQDADSQRLSRSSTLGRPIGCLKVAPNGEKRISHRNMLWIAFAMGLATSIVQWAITSYFPQVDFAQATSLSFAMVAIVVTIAAAVYHIWVKHSRNVEVHEFGLRFSDPADSVNGRREFLWNDADELSKLNNRVIIRSSFGIGELYKVTFVFRLHDFSVAAKSHRLCIVANPTELEVAKFIAMQLECRVDERIMGYT